MMCSSATKDTLLTSKERDNVMRCAAIEMQVSYLLKSHHPMWLCNQRKLKCIVTYARNILKDALKNIDSEQEKSIKRYINNCDFEITYSVQKIAKQKEMIMIPMEMFHEIRDLYMVDCLGCEKDKHAIKKCDLRRKLLRFGLIMPGEDVKDKPCPYMEEL